MSFDPTLNLEGLPALRKPFTPTLDLSITPLKSPYYKGSGGLFLRLSSDEADKRIGLLTCAHVSHPPPLFQNKAYTRRQASHPREDVLLLGTESFNNAVSDILKFIGVSGDHHFLLGVALSKVPVQEENEAKRITARCDEPLGLINAAKTKIEDANELHNNVTKNFTTTESRVFGFVLHSAKIEFSAMGSGAPRQYVQVCSFHQFQRYTNEIRTLVTGNVAEAVHLAEEISRMEAKQKGEAP